MKIPKMSFVWFMVSVVLAALLIFRWNNEGRQKHKIEQLQMQVEESTKAVRLAETRAEEQSQEAARIQSQLRAAEMETFQARQQLVATNQALRANINNASSPKANPLPNWQGGGTQGQGGNPIAQMLKDPEMKKMIQAQQGAMLNMMYAPLYKKLGLTPEETEKMKALLAESQGKATELAGSLFDQDEEAKKGAIKQISEQQQDSQQQIKELLGDERYAKFQDYSSTMSERMMLNQFQQQSNLGQEKIEQLLDMMRQEKAAAQLPDMTSPGAQQEMMGMMSKPEALKKFMEQQKLVNERVVQRAAGLLSPEELKDFAEFQQNQTRMQQIGIETAAKMFGSGNAEQASPPVDLAPPTRQP